MGSALALACGVLAAAGAIDRDRLRGTALLGELALDGRLRPVRGVLPCLLAARAAGMVRAVVPRATLAEAALVDGLEALGADTLGDVLDWAAGNGPLHTADAAAGADGPAGAPPELADVIGQDDARHALEIAAAGGHHLLMVGPPGTGKTMLAQRIVGLLPELDRTAALQLAAIRSVAGRLAEGAPLSVLAPFVAPHHSASAAALLGGGSGVPRPGAVSLAHRGVLFLDEYGHQSTLPDMTDATAPRALLYGRTSLDKSDGRSVDDQLTELRDWAQREGRTVAAQHRDDGISASRFARGKERPGWRAVLDAVDRGEADELALWEGSRGSRDLVEWVRLVDVCAERRVMIVVRGRRFDPADYDDRERLLNDAVRADHESGRVSARVSRSVRSRAASGRPHGGPCYGYKSIHDEHTGKFVKRVPDPVTAPYVVEAVDRLLAGESAGAIVRDYIARDVPTRFGGKWRQSNLVQMVRKPAYAGIRSSSVHELPDDHPADWEPLISRETYDRLLALLADPSRSQARNGRVGGRLLTGIARCGLCTDGRMRTVSKVHRSTVTGERRASKVAYQCRDCLGLSRLAEPVEVYVERIVVNFLSRPDIDEQLADPADDRRALARAEAARLRRKLGEIETAMDADELDVAAGTRLLRSTQDKFDAAEAQARPAHVPTIVLEVAGPAAAERWKPLPVDQRRAIVRALFDVTIHPTKVRNRFDPDAVTVERRNPEINAGRG